MRDFEQSSPRSSLRPSPWPVRSHHHHSPRAVSEHHSPLRSEPTGERRNGEVICCKQHSSPGGLQSRPLDPAWVSGFTARQGRSALATRPKERLPWNPFWRAFVAPAEGVPPFKSLTKGCPLGTRFRVGNHPLKPPLAAYVRDLPCCQKMPLLNPSPHVAWRKEVARISPSNTPSRLG